jgi:tRNA 5-methylaminomethyl-2-thiouridine biosynthesis bifunctional protein
VVAEIEWRQGQPFSPRFGDVYRSTSGAWAQACGVYLQGCGLPRHWQGQAGEFVLLENGFGLGLNFLATWVAWRADPQRCARLHYVGIEAYPGSAQDVLDSASQAEAGPDARVLAASLAQRWRALQPGWQTWRMDAAVDGAQLWLTLAVADASAALAQWPATLAPAQAVYLDGFNPALNPQMWSPALMQSVAAHCAPGARVASYAVAGEVRRALRAAGFTVRKRPGLPPKWHRLEAVLSPSVPAG